VHFEHVRVVCRVGEGPKKERLATTTGTGKEEGAGGAAATAAAAAAAAGGELDGKGTEASAGRGGENQVRVALLVASS